MTDLIQSTRSTGRPALEQLALSVDLSARPRTRLRPDGLLEVVFAGDVLGFVDYQRPVYVVLSGSRIDRAEEIAQRLDLGSAVAVLLGAL